MAYNFTNTYNFSHGNDMIGFGIHTNTSSLYGFTVDLELITVILIVIMICEIIRTSYIFLRHIGLIKGRY